MFFVNRNVNWTSLTSHYTVLLQQWALPLIVLKTNFPLNGSV